MQYNPHNLKPSTSLDLSNLRSPNKKYKKSLEDYEFIADDSSKLRTSDLGAGAYGVVKRVRDKKTNETYAMKIMSKKTIFSYSSKENLKTEIRIQKSIQHPHIISLYHYFEDHENVYIVLEYAENKTLFEYIKNKKKLSENEAFIYFFQTALGLDYLHKRQIIHRDLKPENLLLDKAGNIKICDFGWSAKTSDKRLTYCGTVDYMAPEIVKNLPYDHRVDIWSLGILLYELLHGFAPFLGKSDQQKLNNIANNIPINFDQSLSTEACDLIRRILRPGAVDRLSLEQIFSHPWMKRYEKIYSIDIMSYVNQQHDNEMRDLSVSDESHIEIPLESFVMRKDSRRKDSLCDERSTKENSERSSKGKIITIIDDTTPINRKESVRMNYLLPGEPNVRLNSSGNSSTDGSSRSGSECGHIHHLLKGYQSTNRDKAQSAYLKSASNESQSSMLRNEKVKIQFADNVKDYYGQPRGREELGYEKDLKRPMSSERPAMNVQMAQKRCNSGVRTMYSDRNGGNTDYLDPKMLNKMYQKNNEISKMLKYGKKDKEESSYLEKILIGMGCIAKRSQVYEQ